MRVFHIGARFEELAGMPERVPEQGYLWLAISRDDFEAKLATLQSFLHQCAGGALVDLHVSDLLNRQLPSHFDYTSWYDLLVFRRLAAGSISTALVEDDQDGRLAGAQRALQAIDTSAVGFAVFDRVLLTVHPGPCQILESSILRLAQMGQAAGEPGGDARTASSRLPTSPDDQMLRMVNQMVDGYLELRRLLTRQLGNLQGALLDPRGRFRSWQVLLDWRNALHQLEDICEDQRSAALEWIDTFEERPAAIDSQGRRERELLRVRSRDVVEHIERVLGHVRRLESSAEGAVQIHFSAQSNRANDIMRTLTVLTAIFLPLNLITGFFGMNFDFLPLIHSSSGFWGAFVMMVLVGIGLGLFFWRKRYLGTHH
ncbi:magnesium transporter CorA family protein [Aquabacterium sp. A7-Y]|uniref:magnesium transporter CorA family protein n=1 Tax=Aquabacterium sp. A7-Y TaxID=1349605 RepID=UPI00223C9C7B|nr:magnesium transporter CorA family protein [Aquabacterium sp. A7-Y]MCW7539097.1 magnesium transporter CorA family protein [Aquabacterium sp. A7-Y]